MNSSNKTLLAAALALVAVAAVACSSPTITTEEVPDEDNPSSKTPSSKSDASTPSTNTDPGTGTPTDPDGGTSTTPPTTTDCTSTTTYDTCISCCDAPSGGQLAAADEAFGKCACESGGACASACGSSFCNGDSPSAACDQCLTNTCDPQADALCTSAECQAAVQCVQTSNCNSKE